MLPLYPAPFTTGAQSNSSRTPGASDRAKASISSLAFCRGPAFSASSWASVATTSAAAPCRDRYVVAAAASRVVVAAASAAAFRNAITASFLAERCAFSKPAAASPAVARRATPLRETPSPAVAISVVTVRRSSERRLVDARCCSRSVVAPKSSQNHTGFSPDEGTSVATISSAETATISASSDAVVSAAPSSASTATAGFSTERICSAASVTSRSSVMSLRTSVFAVDAVSAASAYRDAALS